MSEKLDIQNITPDDINAGEVENESDVFMSLMTWLHDENKWDKIKALDIATLANGMIRIANERRWGNIQSVEENATDKHAFPVMVFEKFVSLYVDNDTFINMEWSRPFMRFLQWCGYPNDEIRDVLYVNCGAHNEDAMLRINAYAGELGIPPIYTPETLTPKKDDPITNAVDNMKIH